MLENIQISIYFSIYDVIAHTSLDPFYKLIEREAPVPPATTFIEKTETQPNTSDNEMLKPVEEESRDFGKTPLNEIIDIKKSFSSENLLNLKIY